MEKLFGIITLVVLIGAPSLAVRANGFAMTDCSVTFSPNGGTVAALVKLIGSAKSSVRMLAYNFTSQDVAKALIDAEHRGVDVRAVFDKSVPTERNSALPILEAAGVPYRIDRTHLIAHNKVLLIDGEWVETGSFNYTDNAEHHNGENALACRSAGAYALYLADWQKHWNHSADK